MKIEQIEINGLFGYLDHKIPLNVNDRITIIHGPNGVGKTTILRLVSDLFKSQFLSLLNTPFDNIVISFSSKDTLTVSRSAEDGQRGPDSVGLELTYRRHKKKLIKHSISSQKTEELLGEIHPRYLENMIDHLRRVGPSEWYDELTDRNLSLPEVVLSYGDQLPSRFRKSLLPVPKPIASLFSQTNIEVVETQRLFTRPEEAGDEHLNRYGRRASLRQRMTVEQHAEGMISQIEKYQRESGELGSSLDSSFPKRLLDESLPDTATEEHIRENYTRQSEYRDRLMEAGLLAAETPVPLPSGGLKLNERKVLWVYLGDVDEKLKVFDRLLRQVELFKDIVNSRFLYKKFRVDRERGFVFESNHDGSILPPGALSSGEQHEIVLTYELLFRASKGSLIFIDEPELSLHVIWQRKFLEDIAKISKLADLDFLVATHSPLIVHDRRDLMVELARGEEG